MCRVLAYLGPETPLENLLLRPENSLINQALDPERHPELQLAGWGFGIWGEHLLKPEEPFIYRRPMAAFYDDNASRIIPSLQASTMLAHVRAAAYNSKVVMADENCHPFSFEETPWIVAQNGYLPNWQLLQRELLQHCEDRYLKQMRGNTDTEFIYVLLLSLLEGDSNEDVQRAIEKLIELIAQAMKDLDLGALTKLKMALVSAGRIIGVNVGLGHQGETNPAGDWKELRKSAPDSDDFALSMLLEPMYLLMGRNFEHDATTYDFEESGEDDATGVIFASEPLTEGDDWSHLEFGEIVFLEKDGERITRTINTLKVSAR
ncbi:class II glutamine amidotransferase [Demequina aurantiaca]|uniref:class II glutamine amidotransferase n=1 Tax=Demequina aurantiaca TaxID=676200 RepID=UPI003D341D0A